MRAPPRDIVNKITLTFVHVPFDAVQISFRDFITQLQVDRSVTTQELPDTVTFRTLYVDLLTTCVLLFGIVLLKFLCLEDNVAASVNS